MYILNLCNNKPTKMELDTGAAVSVISNQQWRGIFDDTRALEAHQVNPLQGHAGHKVQVIRQVKVDVEYGHQKKQLPLIIVAGNERPPLFGRNWMQEIQLDWAEMHQIREKVAANIVGRFPAVFSNEVGKIKGYKAVIHLREGTRKAGQ